MLSDDYFQTETSPGNFYEGYELFGATARTKAMMTSLMSIENIEIGSKYGKSGTNDVVKMDRKPKLGSKLAKDIRRLLQREGAGDEILIYAKIMPKVNAFSGRMSRHTGDIVYYIYAIDRNL